MKAGEARECNRLGKPLDNTTRGRGWGEKDGCMQHMSMYKRDIPIVASFEAIQIRGCRQSKEEGDVQGHAHR